MTHPLVSIVLPVYNQADHIGTIVESYIRAVAEAAVPVEFVLVPNGSRDKSHEICAGLAERFSCVATVHSERGGWGLAVRTGIAHARGRSVCFTNSARTQPEDLLRFVRCAVENPDTVIKATREIRDNWKRRLGSHLYNLECRVLFDVPYRDINGTPKIFPTRFSRLLKLRQDGDLLDAEFLAVCRRERYPVEEVPVASSRRHGGRSTTRYSSAVRMYWGVFQMWREFRSRGWR